MKYALLGTMAVVFVSGMAISAFAQTAAIERDLVRRMQDMRALESYSRRRSEKDRREMESMNPPGLDKKAKERVRTMRMLDTRDFEQYKTLLASEKKAGIFRLFPDFDCVSRNLVNIGSECRDFVPESSDFSFRSVAYTSRFYHDLGFDRTELVSDSFFSQGILVPLGDVPIEKVDLELAELKYLTEIQPDVLIPNAKKTSRNIGRGVDAGGFHYSTSVIPYENTTYALRNIAYGISGSLPSLKPDSTMTEIKFKSLEMDSRDDVIVAFRIVRKDTDGGLTIVWKELSRREAPKLKFAKGEVLADFK